MARIRSIHPGQWTDDGFVDCSAFARLLAIGLRNEADDNGIFAWKPSSLKMRLLPADTCEVKELLQELVDSEQVHRYTVDGKDYGMIRNFQRYQRAQKPTFHYPTPPEPLPYGYKLHASFFDTTTGLVQEGLENPVSWKEGKGRKEGNNMSGTPDGRVNNFKQDAETVLDFLNEKTGSRYRPVDANVNPIVKILRDGTTVATCRQVIASKCREWGKDEKFSQYLRPKTLFAASNFANYEGALGPPGGDP